MKGLIVLVAVVAVVGAAFAYIKYAEKPQAPEGFVPTDFYECAKYFPVQESYPRRCTSKVGAQFAEDIGNAFELQTEIIANAPRPGDFINSPLTVRGSARAAWFDEQTIRVEVLSSNADLLGKDTLDTKKVVTGDALYPFEGSVVFEAPAFGSSGTVLIYKGAGREALRIPVRFK